MPSSPSLFPTPAALRAERAARRLDASAYRLAEALRRAAALEARVWNPDQPRVPAGRTGGGRWTDGLVADVGDTLDETPTRPQRIRLADGSGEPSPEFRAELQRRIDAADERLANAYARASSGLEISHAEIDRARLTIAEKAVEAVGSTDWAQSVAKDNYPAGSNKCNLFVYDVLKSVEADPPLANGGVLYNWFGAGAPRYPVLAGQWADPGFRVEGWDIVEGSPAIGDLVAVQRRGESYAGHVAVFVGFEFGEPRTVSAFDDMIVFNDWPYGNKNRLIWIRRYRGMRAP